MYDRLLIINYAGEVEMNPDKHIDIKQDNVLSSFSFLFERISFLMEQATAISNSITKRRQEEMRDQSCIIIQFYTFL